MPVLGVVFCALLLFGLGVSTWVAFALWMAVGLAIYFAYGVRKSALRNSPETVTAP